MEEIGGGEVSKKESSEVVTEKKGELRDEESTLIVNINSIDNIVEATEQ